MPHASGGTEMRTPLRARRLVLFAAATLAGLANWAGPFGALPLDAQTPTLPPGGLSMTRSVPPPSYFGTFRAFNEGEYKDALKGFQAEGRGGIKTSTSRWIDSICYHAMSGECYYHMG